MDRTIDVSIPGRVWDDFLNPDVSEMQRDLGLSLPIRQKAGKGFRVIYHALPLDVAAELAEYLHDRGDMLLGQSIADSYDPWEKASRDTYRAAIKAAAAIRETVNRP